MSWDTYQQLNHKPYLSPTAAVLSSPGGALHPRGQFTAMTLWQGQKYRFRVFVVGRPTDTLLGRGVATHMGLVKRIDEVNKRLAELPKMLTEPVHIALEEDADPYAVHTARRVVIPLFPKVKDELTQPADFTRYPWTLKVKSWQHSSRRWDVSVSHVSRSGLTPLQKSSPGRCINCSRGKKMS